MKRHDWHDAARSRLCRLWLQMTATAWDGSSCILEILASHRPSFLDSLWSRHIWVCTDMEVDGNITISPRPQVGNYSYWWFDLFYLLGAKRGKYGLADQNEDGGGPCSCWEYLYKPAPGCFLWKMSVSEEYDGDVRHESMKGSACSLSLALCAATATRTAWVSPKLDYNQSAPKYVTLPSVI